jgi:iron complex transport system permease protein
MTDLALTRTTKTSTRWKLLLGIVCALALVLIALSIGRYPITPNTLVAMLSGNASVDPNAAIVLWNIRLPRIVAAMLVGAALAAAGAAYQNLFRNPLVSPDVLGVSSGAALGATIAILFGLSIVFIQTLAFIGGLIAVFAITALGRAVEASRGGGGGHAHMSALARDPVLTLVLIGIVIGGLLGSFLALAKYIADPYNQLPAITYWLLGSFSAITKRDLAIAAPIIFVSLVPLFLLRWRINLLALDEDEAKTLGQDLRRLRWLVIVCATLMTGAAVALCGIVGWVGLVVPHAVRLLVGAEFSRLLPLSMIVGASFMLAIDTIGRSIAQIEIPPGVLTAFIGAPLFIWLMVVGVNRKHAAQHTAQHTKART